MREDQEKERARKRRHHKFRIRERARRFAKNVYGYNEREYQGWASSAPCAERVALARELVDVRVPSAARERLRWGGFRGLSARPLQSPPPRPLAPHSAHRPRR